MTCIVCLSGWVLALLILTIRGHMFNVHVLDDLIAHRLQNNVHANFGLLDYFYMYFPSTIAGYYFGETCANAYLQSCRNSV